MSKRFPVLMMAFALSAFSVLAANSRINDFRSFATSGGRVDWSPQNRLAFDRAGSDGFFDVYVANADGSNELCITCDRQALPNRHAGNPAWHPSGNYIALQVQKSLAPLGAVTDRLASPGIGLNNDLWIADSIGSQFWRMTDLQQGIGAVLHPHFNHRGDRIIWSERISSSGGAAGTWALKIAEFVVEGGTPVVRNVQTFQPGRNPRFYESHGFSVDDKRVLFSSNSDGQAEDGYDIYWLDLTTGAATNLTSTPSDWDEHAQLSPSGEYIIFISSTNQPPSIGNALRTDYWIMREDGSEKARLTYFSDPDQPEYMPEPVSGGDNSWSPDGTRVMFYMITDNFGARGRNYVAEMSSAVAVSGASMSGYAMAPDSLISVFGKNLASGIQSASSLPLPSELDGTSVRVTDSRGVTRNALLVYVSPTQINCLLPPETALGTAKISVQTRTGGVGSGAFQIFQTAPGIYTANASGVGAPAALIQRVLSDGRAMAAELAFQCGATAGSCSEKTIDFGDSGDRLFLTLFGTGIRSHKSIAITIDGIPAPVSYAGPQKQIDALDQINVELPRSLIGRGLVIVRVTIDGRQANPVILRTR